VFELSEAHVNGKGALVDGKLVKATSQDVSIDPFEGLQLFFTTNFGGCPTHFSTAKTMLC
jgi:hypothetical protein